MVFIIFSAIGCTSEKPMRTVQTRTVNSPGLRPDHRLPRLLLAGILPSSILPADFLPVSMRQPKERLHTTRAKSTGQQDAARDLKEAPFWRDLNIWLIIILSALFLLSLLSYQRQKRLIQSLREKNRTILQQQAELQAQKESLQHSRDTVRELSLFKERLAHMAAHDMRNPLNVILALSEDPRRSKYMAEIHEAGSDLMNLINNLLDTYKFEQAEIQLNKKQVRPAELVLAGIRQVKKMRLQSGVEIETYLDRLLEGPLDPELITRVVVNLLNNAIKFSPPTGIITVRLYRNKQRDISLEVEDQGPGVAEQQQEEIFQMMHEKGAQLIRGSASTGIGLNFCRLAVQAHGGNIQVQSAPGGGSIFVVVFPGQSFIKTMSASSTKQHEPFYELLIAPEDQIAVQQVAEQLADTKVFEVSKIERALQRFSPETHRSLWPQEIRAAMYRGDQRSYLELIKKAEYGPSS